MARIPEPLLTQQDYVASRGKSCPFCKNRTALQAGSVEVCGSQAYQNVTCMEDAGGCGAQYTDDFELVGFSAIDA